MIAAVTVARSEWLLFLPPGSDLDSGWVADVQQFIERAPADIAAAFGFAARPHGQDSLLTAMLALWRARRASLAPGRGLIISKTILSGTRRLQGDAGYRGRISCGASASAGWPTCEANLIRSEFLIA